MSSGACRALVAALLSLATVLLLAVPGMAKTEALKESSSTTYEVDPATRTVTVETVIPLENNQETPYNGLPWGPIIVEESANPRLSRGFEIDSRRDVPGPWTTFDVTTPEIEPGESRRLSIRYTLDAGGRRQTPVRIDDGYLYFCVVGQDTDLGTVTVRIAGRERYALTQSGTPLDVTDFGLASPPSRSPGDVFTCIEGTVDENLQTGTFIGPGDRQVELQAIPSDPNWLVAADRNVGTALDAIAAFLGHDIPGQGPLVVRQTPTRQLGGYASAHDTLGIVQLDDDAGTPGPGRQSLQHQMAHAWFGADNVTERWLREGLAEWIATSMAGAECEPVAARGADLDLADWQVVRPNAANDIDEVMDAQLRASCGIVSATRARMGEEQWQAVLAGLLDGDTKYNGSRGPSRSNQTTIDYREWLDAVDELGLVPAGMADEAYAGNLEDLDLAQDLLAAYQIPVDPGALEQRSEARAAYHQFLAESDGLAAPLAVRQALDDWEFGEAVAHLDKSREILAALREADSKLPNAELIPVIQPMFEAASSDDELDAVLTRSQDLLTGAIESIESLTQLSEALPQGWVVPAAVNEALNEQRFDDIPAIIPPALEVAAAISAADAVLPEAGLPEKYRSRFETSRTATSLQELADELADEAEQVTKAGAALRQLEIAAADWAIPSAVTAPVDAGRLDEALPVLEDALAVVTATREGDAALPEAEMTSDFRPRFEAVTDAAEMAALSTEARAMAQDAKTVGLARANLTAQLPGWRLPPIVQRSINERDLAAAADAAGLAQKWFQNAASADQKLPRMNALERVRQDFESAASIEELEAGAKLSEQWNIAASSVAEVVERAQKPLDLLATLGMWGSSVDVDPAITAAVQGDVQLAINRSAAVSQMLNDASSVGGLRLAGMIFFVVAIVGVAGLWIMLRRQAGPSWARQRKPHWLKDDRTPRLGRGRKGGKDKGGDRNKTAAPAIESRNPQRRGR